MTQHPLCLPASCQAMYWVRHTQESNENLSMILLQMAEQLQPSWSDWPELFRTFVQG